MNKLQKYYLCILGLPKTIYFNFKYLPLKDAIKLPIFISHRVYLLQCQGTVKIDAPITPALIRIGFGHIPIFDMKRSRSVWKVGGKVIFKGKANIGHGTKIYVDGTLTLGSNFEVTAETQIYCRKKITFGNDVLVSWNNLFIDTDGHSIRANGEIINHSKDIEIGNHVWMGCRCMVLKGTKIPDETVIAANSTLTSSFDEKNTNTIVGGSPAKVLKENIQWDTVYQDKAKEFE